MDKEFKTKLSIFSAFALIPDMVRIAEVKTKKERKKKAKELKRKIEEIKKILEE